MTRALKALAGVAIVVAMVVLGFRALGGDDRPSGGDPAAVARTPRTMPPTPSDVPAEGMYVVSTVTSEGEVDVQTWLRAPQPISELELTTTDPDLLPGSVESLDLIVRGMDGALLAHRDDVGTNPQTIRLREPASELYLTYTVDGGMDDASSTVAGRSLARVLAMDVDYAGAGGDVRRLVAAPGTVLNVACLHATEDFDATPRPCGAPSGDGDWLVDLHGNDRSDRLLAQLEG
jgi:hypothetical protein